MFSRYVLYSLVYSKRNIPRAQVTIYCTYFVLSKLGCSTKADWQMYSTRIHARKLDISRVLCFVQRPSSTLHFKKSLKFKKYFLVTKYSSMLVTYPMQNKQTVPSFLVWERLCREFKLVFHRYAWLTLAWLPLSVLLIGDISFDLATWCAKEKI